MRRLGLLLLLLAFAVPATPAAAGGWASVELASAPGCLTAGKPWRVELHVKQHGITPLDDARPTIRVTDGKGTVRTFAARHAGRPGTYAATVTFPRGGTWQTRIFDGWTDATPHRLAPLEVAAKGAAPDSSCRRDTAAASTEATTASPGGSGPTWRPSNAVAPPPADDGLPFPQITAIGLVLLLWAAAWVALTGPPRALRRLRRAPQRYVPAR
jgi:YtkA-like protein